ncbi:Aste57867_25368 [Aphanomyces stellatus]|uniref:Aste57867_25368 protein n=1 Tax=Aphanomyces stellatus TaxID=120398 RepID=A0A485LTX4_9STRA|nr:hypothetical protein As57867_025290 [Aphanomyces stellatus]VFU01993.1 Aste57867_25368 [Aphanomyces stellatus]
MHPAIASVLAASASAVATWYYLHLPSVASTTALSTSDDDIHHLQTALLALEEALAAPSRPDASQWQQSLQDAIPAIVTIRVMAVRHFDGDRPMYSVATGFVVDKVRGLILTNRHVVTPGPVVADAVFVNHEEVDLIPVYRDPVHDFGFFRFDPTKIRFLALHEIPLRPDLAAVGTDIRVVGNDNGEKMQILPGILAKLDRDAPQYGLLGYNDFNTFYYSAASSTSGGSSGSPVLNVDGAAVALNAGGATNAASSYYLPLDRVQRALMLLQATADGTPPVIPRGTWQTIFRHAAFDEGRKLGLPAATERAIRAAAPTETGVLVVDQVVPDGPADGLLHVGDVLLQVDTDPFTTTFLALEDTLDAHVGRTLNLTIQRGGKTLWLSLPVQNLHAITPSRFLEVGQCLLHDLSFQQARNMALPVGGVYLAAAGHMLYKADIYDPCIIVAVDDKPTACLDDFIVAIQDLHHGYRTSLQYFSPTNRHVVESAVIAIDRQWFPMQLYTRNDTDGLWHPHVFAVPPLRRLESSSSTVDTPPPAPLQTDAPWSTTLLASMVFVRFDTPLTIDGISMSSYDGVGYVVDGTQGLVLVDQYTVPVALGEVTVTVAASTQVPATIRFVHPIHNFAIVQYDVAAIGVLPSLPLTNHVKSLHVGDALEFVGLTRSWSVLTMTSVVTKIDRLVTTDFKVPRYKPGNVELVSFDLLSSSARGGLFVDPADGAVAAFYLAFVAEDSADGAGQAFAYGLPVHVVQDVVAAFRRGQPPTSIPWLPVDLGTMSLSDARAAFGLSPARLKSLEQCYDDTRQVLTILRCMAQTQASAQLRSGDIVLAIDGHVVAKDDDVARACAGKPSVEMVILRHKQEMTLVVETVALSGFGTDRVVLWGGLLLQAPHTAVLQRGYSSGGVYCSQWFNGSPAEKYNLHSSRFIVAVNDVLTPTLDAFLDVVLHLAHGDSVRLDMRDLETRPEMATLKTDNQYWPTLDVQYSTQSDRWEVVQHKA